MRNVLSLVLAAALAVAGGVVGSPAGFAVADTAGAHGLKGEYYVSSAPGAFDFGELKATTRDGSVDFDDLEGTFESLTGQSDNVTVRWTGKIQPQYSEEYTFSMVGDNGFRLWVDGQLIIDHWVDDWNNEQTSAPIALEAGRKYDIKVEYFDHTGGSNLHLSWGSPSQPKAIIPPSALYVPEDFDYAGPSTATVSEDGKAVSLGFDQDLAPLPSGAADHLSVRLGGRDVPVESIALAGDDASIIRIALTNPITQQAGNSVRAVYDGSGGITFADGSAVDAFNAFVLNNSSYTLTTPWTDQVSKTNPHPEYPRPQLKRPRWESLNGQWQFAAATEGEAPPFGQTLDEQILVPFPVESKLSGVQRHEDRMWYRRTFTVPENWNVESGQRLLLHFGAVDWKATVYVNGERVATHKGGYDHFTVDVTDALRMNADGGAQQKQELVIGVYDPTDRGAQAIGKQRLNPGGIWYTANSGIWQSVWLEPVPEAHITGLDMTPDISRESLGLTVNADGGSGQTVVATAYADGRRVSTVRGDIGAELRLPVPRPRLWSPDHPFLYDLNVKLVDGDETVDEVDSYFGMREVGMKKVGGVLRPVLNGEFVFQIGPLDQGYWPDGIYTAPTDEALKYDLVKTKQLGYNTVRKHVKVEPARWYYWADKLGLIVWQDMPSMFPPGDDKPNAAEARQFEHELQQMIQELGDHPSITTWVPFNEGWGQYDSARITERVEQWDPTRLTDNNSGVNCCGSVDGGNGDLLDWHTYGGYEGYTSPVPEEDRAAVVGEYGGLALMVPGHTWAGHGFGHGEVSTAGELTEQYVRMIDKTGRMMRCPGLSAAIYTQTTDVEIEINGMLTYDRRVMKPDVDQIRAAHQQLIDASKNLEGTACQ